MVVSDVVSEVVVVGLVDGQEASLPGQHKNSSGFGSLLQASLHLQMRKSSLPGPFWTAIIWSEKQNSSQESRTNENVVGLVEVVSEVVRVDVVVAVVSGQNVK